MSYESDRLDQLFSSEYFIRYRNRVVKFLKKNTKMDLVFVSNFEYDFNTVFTGYLRGGKPFFGEFERDGMVYFGLRTQPKKDPITCENGYYMHDYGDYYEFGENKNERIRREKDSFLSVYKGKRFLRKIEAKDMPVVDFYNLQTRDNYLEELFPPRLTNVNFIKNEYKMFYGEVKDGVPCGYGIYFYSKDLRSESEEFRATLGYFDGWNLVKSKFSFIETEINYHKYRSLNIGYKGLMVSFTGKKEDYLSYSPQFRVYSFTKDKYSDDIIAKNIFHCTFWKDQINASHGPKGECKKNIVVKYPFSFDYSVPPFRPALILLHQLLSGDISFFEKIMEQVDFLLNIGYSKSELFELLRTGDGSDALGEIERLWETHLKESEEAIRSFDEREKQEKKRKEEERQRKLRERKQKIEKVENVKSFMSKVFNHALTEWKKYQGGEKCEIRLMTIDYQAENEKLVVIYKVSVVVLGSVGAFTYGPSWVDKQGRYHKATTADDARRSARRAVEFVQQHAVSELEKELNSLYFDRWHNGIGQDAAPLPIDRVILRVELTNRGVGKYDIRVG